MCGTRANVGKIWGKYGQKSTFPPLLPQNLSMNSLSPLNLVIFPNFSPTNCLWIRIFSSCSPLQNQRFVSRPTFCQYLWIPLWGLCGENIDTHLQLLISLYDWSRVGVKWEKCGYGPNLVPCLFTFRLCSMFVHIQTLFHVCSHSDFVPCLFTFRLCSTFVHQQE